MEPSFVKKSHDFEGSCDFGVPREIWLDLAFDLILALFWLILSYFDLFRQADLTYFHLLSTNFSGALTYVHLFSFHNSETDFFFHHHR